MQLCLFEIDKPLTKEYAWTPFWDWMPQVNELAQMDAYSMPNLGYCYGDIVRIISIEGESVVCVVESQRDSNWWKNGVEYKCTFQDLWPPIYKQ